MSAPPVDNAYYPINLDKSLYNRENAIAIYNKVQRALPEQELDQGHSDIIKRLMRAANPTWYPTVQHFIDDIAKKTVAEVTRTTLGRIDVHEMLVKEMSREDQAGTNAVTAAAKLSNSFNSSISINDFLGTRSMGDFRSLIAPKDAAKKAYLTFDSFMRDISNDGTKLFKWTLSTSNTVTQGTVNNTNSIRNMVAMRVYPFKIPYATSADNNNQISMGVEEFRSQGSLMYNQNFWHFMFTAVRDGQSIKLETAYNNDGLFEFATPIAAVDTFTMSFRNPVNLITFSTDRSNGQVLSYGTEMVIRCSRAHNLATGDLVIISDFTTINPTYDQAIINTITDENGINIDISAVPITTTDFSLFVNATSIYNTAPAGTISVTNASDLVVGLGTSFQTLFRPGDRIVIAGLGYLVKTITTDTQLNLTSDYTGATASGLAFIKDNTIDNLTFTCYFASKRFVIPMEVTYLDVTPTP